MINKGLIDNRLGIIKDINLNKKDIFYTYTAQLNRIDRYLNWRPDYVGSGTSLSKIRAFNSAVGEAIERYSGNFIPKNLLFSNIENLNGSYLSPEIFLKFSENQFNFKGFPFKKFNVSEKLEWVIGEDIIKNKKIYIPAKFVYLNYWMYKKNELNINQTPILLSGVAAGESYNFALKSAILEIIERDVTMIWWLGNREQTEILLEKNDDLYLKIVKKLPKNLKMRWFLLPSDFNLYTIASSIIDEKNNIFCIGFATRFSLYDAMEKSASEAFQLYIVSNDMINENSNIWKSNELIKYLGVKEYNKKRDYKNSFKSDFSDMLSLKHNLQYFLDKNNWGNAIIRLNNIKNKLKYKSFNDIKVKDEILYLIEEFKKNKMSLYVVDITTKDINELGFKVVRVISPEACPNMPTALPMLENERLKKFAKRDTNKKIKFDLSPLPHS